MTAECWCDANTEPTCNVSCAKLKEHGRVMGERDRYRDALRVAAEDLRKAANQFAGIRQAQEQGPWKLSGQNEAIFAEKAARAEAALDA